MSDDSDRIEERAAAHVILDSHAQHVANRISAGGGDHCLPELLTLESERDAPRKPVLDAIADRLAILGRE
jgi:hypothetical protein